MRDQALQGSAAEERADPTSLQTTSRQIGLTAGILLGGFLVSNAAQADCVGPTVTGNTVTTTCTGTTTVPATPTQTIPPGLNTSVVLGDTNPANVTVLSGTFINATVLGGPANALTADTGTAAAPGSATAQSGFTVSAPNGASILIGQNQPGGFNANITGIGGVGIQASTGMTGTLAITTATGTTIKGSTDALNLTVANGPMTLVLNGNVTGGLNGINASSTGTGPISVSTGGVISGGGGYGITTTSSGGGSTVINVGAGSIVTGTTGAINLTTASGGVINNSGTIAGTIGTAGPVTINNLASGTISLVNGSPTQTLSATTYNGGGGTIAIDVNAKTGAADKFAFTNLSGTTTIAINPVGGASVIASPLLIGSAATTAPGTAVNVAASPGLINYQVQQSGGNYYLVSTLNTSIASAAPAGIDSIITALNTGFFQNSSAFISEPTNPKPNQWNGGPWIRVSTGSNDITATTSAANPTGGTSTAPSKVRANFSGFQVGGDFGVANIENSGWNTHLGVTGGVVTIGTNDLLNPTTSARSNVPFVGVYAAVTGHNFFADVQFRQDFYNLSINNAGAFLAGAPLHGSAYNFNGSVGYRFDLGSNWFIEPSGAMSYSHLSMNSLTVGLDGMGSTGSIAFNAFNSLLGRLGARVGTTYVIDSAALALQPFVTGSVWREFAGNTSSTFITSTASVPLSVTRIGTFGQVGVGVSGQILNTGLLGFLRGDYRFGDHLNGYALIAGMRYQF